MTTRAALVAISLSSLAPIASASGTHAGRSEFPAAAFEVCRARPVGSSCSVDAAQGLCAASASPGEAYCFRAPEVHLVTSARPRAEIQAAVSHHEFPQAAFDACTGRSVGALCGTETHGGQCVQASEPGRSFCFVPPASSLGHGVLVSANVLPSER